MDSKAPLFDALGEEALQFIMATNTSLDETIAYQNQSTELSARRHGRALNNWRWLENAGRMMGMGNGGVGYCGKKVGLTDSDMNSKVEWKRCWGRCKNEMQRAKGTVSQRKMQECLRCRPYRDRADLGCAMHDFCGGMRGQGANPNLCGAIGGITTALTLSMKNLVYTVTSALGQSCHCKCDYQFVWHQAAAMLDKNCQGLCKEIATLTFVAFRGFGSCWKHIEIKIPIPYFKCGCRSCACPRFGIKWLRIRIPWCFLGGSGNVRG